MATAILSGTYTQANRPMEVITPLGKDVLLLIGFSGHEAISQLFSFQLDMLAPNQVTVPFDQLLGQDITVRLDMPGGLSRYFNGLCIRVSQGMRDNNFTGYRMEIVPQYWIWTKHTHIRTFQHMTVPDILKQVLDGLDVSYEIQGNFEQRDYVVQFRESDYNFANRMMEDEGIFYFFKHTADGHQMVLANTPQSHPDLPQRSDIIFEETLGGKREEDRVTRWEKVQELRSGTFRMWDHTFEMPYKSLNVVKKLQDSVQVGQVTHKMLVGTNDQMEIYDYPGEYAGRFDGVNAGGAPQPAELQKIFQDNQRTAGIRVQQEAVQGLVVQGVSTCRQFTSGHKFQLQRHFNADDEYVVTSCQHEAKANVDYRSGDPGEYLYQNLFTCIPLSLPFRPPRVTPKPTVEGTQTALVVGPPGEEIFTDKYGRVKVQFKWDRDGENDGNSSCWVRVTQPWSGQRWGMYHIPRIGQEVIVDFLEGDPDQPIITGTVYNAHQMPAYLGDGLDPAQAHNPHLSGIKTCSTPGGDGFNELRFCDTKGAEHVFIHAEKDQHTRVKNDSLENIGNDKHMNIGKPGDSGAGDRAGSGDGGGGQGGNLLEKVFNDKNLQVLNDMFHKVMGNKQDLTQGNHDHVTDGNKTENTGGNHDEHVEGDHTEKTDGNEDVTTDGDRKVKIGGDDNLHIEGDNKIKVEGEQSLHVQGDRKVQVEGTQSLHVQGDQKEQIEGKVSLTIEDKVDTDLQDKYLLHVGDDFGIKVDKKYGLEAVDEIYLKAKKIVIEASDEITLKGPNGFIKIGNDNLYIRQNKVMINSGGSPGDGTSPDDADPEDPEDPTDPDDPQDPEQAQRADPPDPDDSLKTASGIPSQDGAPIGQQNGAGDTALT